MTKTYSSKSNALRAYLAANPDCGMDREELSLYLVNNHMGAGTNRWVVVLDHDGQASDDDVVSGDEVDPAQCDECGHELASPGSDCHNAECTANPEYEPELETDVPIAPLRDIKGTGAYKDVPLRRRTIEAGAVSWAWSVFDAMPAGSKRKAAIAEAVRQGIAFYTARTQYQKWQHRGDAKGGA